MADFALGKAAMVQNGNWGWSQISEVSGNTVKAEDVHFMPIYVAFPARTSPTSPSAPRTT